MLDHVLGIQLKVRDTADLGPQSPFTAMTRSQCDSALRGLREEIDAQATLAIVASIEALFQVDAKRRREERRKGTLANDLKRLHRAARPPHRRVLFERILKVWREATGAAHLFASFKPFIRDRHWLAHGRWWEHPRAISPGLTMLAWRELEQRVKLHLLVK